MKIIVAELVIKIPLVCKSVEALENTVDHYLQRLQPFGPSSEISHTLASKEVEVTL